MNQNEIISAVAEDVKTILAKDSSGHDWWHVYRAWNMAKQIGAVESADLFVVELAAVLHDVADWKFHDGDDTVGPKKAREVLEKYQVDESVIEHVCEIIADMSFKGAGVETPMPTLEGKIVQDADRLDAIGAIGIARTFAYGGHKSKPMHDPKSKPVMHTSKEDYFKNNVSTINHFYEKLLLLKDRMNTITAKQIAQERHAFMEQFLDQFFREWEGKQ